MFSIRGLKCPGESESVRRPGPQAGRGEKGAKKKWGAKRLSSGGYPEKTPDSAHGRRKKTGLGEPFAKGRLASPAIVPQKRPSDKEFQPFCQGWPKRFRPKEPDAWPWLRLRSSAGSAPNAEKSARKKAWRPSGRPGHAKTICAGTRWAMDRAMAQLFAHSAGSQPNTPQPMSPPTKDSQCLLAAHSNARAKRSARAVCVFAASIFLFD